MRISDITVRTVTRKMPSNQRNARRAWTEKAFLFCFVTTEDGHTGIGEGWTSYASPRALAATIEDDVAPHVINRDLEVLDDLNPRIRDACVMSGRYGILAVALSAVEMALYDLRAQLARQPLWRYLGGTLSRVPVYASGGLYAPGKTPADLGQEVAGWVADGHRAVKIKVGGASLEDDIARIVACRRAIGDGIALLVDAHYTMTVETAATFAQAAQTYDVGWFEAPIRPDDWAGHDALVARSPIPLCGNETLPWRDSFARLSEAGVAYLMPDVSACGGIAETLAIADIASQNGAALTLHSSSSIVLFLASLNVAAAHTATHSVEYHMMHRWFYDLVDAPFRIEEGLVALDETPGLGLDAERLLAAIGT